MKEKSQGMCKQSVYNAKSTTMLCGCGNKAIKWKGAGPVCARCHKLEETDTRFIHSDLFLHSKRPRLYIEEYAHHLTSI